jgi:hypothetical protein
MIPEDVLDILVEYCDEESLFHLENEWECLSDGTICIERITGPQWIKLSERDVAKRTNRQWRQTSACLEKDIMFDDSLQAEAARIRGRDYAFYAAMAKKALSQQGYRYTENSVFDDNLHSKELSISEGPHEVFVHISLPQDNKGSQSRCWKGHRNFDSKSGQIWWYFPDLLQELAWLECQQYRDQFLGRLLSVQSFNNFTEERKERLQRLLSKLEIVVLDASSILTSSCLVQPNVLFATGPYAEGCGPRFEGPMDVDGFFHAKSTVSMSMQEEMTESTHRYPAAKVLISNGPVFLLVLLDHPMIHTNPL